MKRTKEPSTRELQIIALIAKGLTAKQISNTLEPKVSRRTVDAHTANIFRKLGVSNSNELVAVCYEKRYIVFEEYEGAISLLKDIVNKYPITEKDREDIEALLIKIRNK